MSRIIFNRRARVLVIAGPNLIWLTRFIIPIVFAVWVIALLCCAVPALFVVNMHVNVIAKLIFLIALAIAGASSAIFVLRRIPDYVIVCGNIKSIPELIINGNKRDICATWRYKIYIYHVNMIYMSAVNKDNCVIVKIPEELLFGAEK